MPKKDAPEVARDKENAAKEKLVLKLQQADFDDLKNILQVNMVLIHFPWPIYLTYLCTCTDLRF